MPDFLSRLVERTFGLIPVAQPVPSSIFSPAPSLKSDHVQGLALDNESVSNQDNIYIDSSPKTRVISQHNDQPPLNRKKPYYEDGEKLPGQIKDGDSQSYSTSVSRQPHNISPHNIEPLKQNDSGFPEQIESVSLPQIGEQDNRYLHTSPAELAQDNEPLYRIDSGILESVEPEPLYAKGRNGRSTLQIIPKSIFHAEQFHRGEQYSQGHIEPFVNSVDSPAGKTLIEYESDSSLISGSSPSLKSGEALVQNSEPASRADFYPPSDLNLDARSPPTIPSRQNLKRVSTPKVNATLEQMGNMLLEQHAVAPRYPTTVPTIKVTIGRIEVRAVKPSLEPQPQTPPPRQHPILSLDDYLKQYNG